MLMILPDGGFEPATRVAALLQITRWPVALVRCPPEPVDANRLGIEREAPEARPWSAKPTEAAGCLRRTGQPGEMR